MIVGLAGGGDRRGIVARMDNCCTCRLPPERALCYPLRLDFCRPGASIRALADARRVASGILRHSRKSSPGRYSAGYAGSFRRTIMARVCQVTGKGVMSGNNVSHAN
ncbi:MAG TPA: L28 family ribosomal protein, partial [Rhodanobacteraceae bacterium]|nr:L28 family ribosomal protein [Rhodanobacteraceae bacterium]